MRKASAVSDSPLRRDPHEERISRWLRLYTTCLDLIHDVIIDMHARMFRTFLMTLAVALSIGALVASVGISRNAARQIDSDIAASTLTEVIVTPRSLISNGTGRESRQELGDTGLLFPEGVEERVEHTHNILAAGRRMALEGERIIDRALVQKYGIHLHVEGVTSRYFDATGISVSGPTYLLDTDMNIAFLGKEAAQQLGIVPTGDTSGISFEINGKSYSVAGFIHGDNGLISSIVLPYARVLSTNQRDDSASLYVRTAPGAGAQIARVVPYVISPDHPERLATSSVVMHAKIRNDVAAQLTRQGVWIGTFLMTLTILLVANSMIVAVTSRISEIGVRRALGSSRGAVAAVFWVEGAIVGLVGGFLGSAVAVLVILVVALSSQWGIYLAPLWIGLGPILGLAVGLLASAYPAFRAARIQPALAVRAE